MLPSASCIPIRDALRRVVRDEHVPTAAGTAITSGWKTLGCHRNAPLATTQSIRGGAQLSSRNVALLSPLSGDESRPAQVNSLPSLHTTSRSIPFGLQSVRVSRWSKQRRIQCLMQITDPSIVPSSRRSLHQAARHLHPSRMTTRERIKQKKDREDEERRSREEYERWMQDTAKLAEAKRQHNEPVRLAWEKQSQEIEEQRLRSAEKERKQLEADQARKDRERRALEEKEKKQREQLLLIQELIHKYSRRQADSHTLILNLAREAHIQHHLKLPRAWYQELDDVVERIVGRGDQLLQEWHTSRLLPLARNARQLGLALPDRLKEEVDSTEAIERKQLEELREEKIVQDRVEEIERKRLQRESEPQFQRAIRALKIETDPVQRRILRRIITDTVLASETAQTEIVKADRSRTASQKEQQELLNRTKMHEYEEELNRIRSAREADLRAHERGASYENYRDVFKMSLQSWHESITAMKLLVKFYRERSDRELQWLQWNTSKDFLLLRLELSMKTATRALYFTHALAHSSRFLTRLVRYQWPSRVDFDNVSQGRKYDAMRREWHLRCLNITLAHDAVDEVSCHLMFLQDMRRAWWKKHPPSKAEVEEHNRSESASRTLRALVNRFSLIHRTISGQITAHPRGLAARLRLSWVITHGSLAEKERMYTSWPLSSLQTCAGHLRGAIALFLQWLKRHDRNKDRHVWLVANERQRMFLEELAKAYDDIALEVHYRAVERSHLIDRKKREAFLDVQLSKTLRRAQKLDRKISERHARDLMKQSFFYARLFRSREVRSTPASLLMKPSPAGQSIEGSTGGGRVLKRPVPEITPKSSHIIRPGRDRRRNRPEAATSLKDSATSVFPTSEDVAAKTRSQPSNEAGINGPYSSIRPKLYNGDVPKTVELSQTSSQQQRKLDELKAQLNKQDADLAQQAAKLSALVAQRAEQAKLITEFEQFKDADHHEGLATVNGPTAVTERKRKRAEARRLRRRAARLSETTQDAAQSTCNASPADKSSSTEVLSGAPGRIMAAQTAPMGDKSFANDLSRGRTGKLHGKSNATGQEAAAKEQNPARGASPKKKGRSLSKGLAPAKDSVRIPYTHSPSSPTNAEWGSLSFSPSSTRRIAQFRQQQRAIDAIRREQEVSKTPPERRWSPLDPEAIMQQEHAIGSGNVSKRSSVVKRWSPLNFTSTPKKDFCRSMPWTTDQSSVVHEASPNIVDEVSTGPPLGEEQGNEALVSVQPISNSASRNNDAPTLLNTEQYLPMAFQIPDDVKRRTMLSSTSSGSGYWSFRLYRNANEPRKSVTVHYCTTLKDSERAAQQFLGEKVLGFDLEWKTQAKSTDGIKDNVSLIQIASESRIGLFQIARFEGSAADELLAPTLKTILESQNVIKVGVWIRGDATRVETWLGVKPQNLLELSHLYRVVKYGLTAPHLVNKRLVSLATQVQELLQLPLFKGEVRVGDWRVKLNAEQVDYAANDAYAALRVFEALDSERRKMNPMPRMPYPAELELDIPLPPGVVRRRPLKNDPVEEDTDGAIADVEADASIDAAKSSAAVYCPTLTLTGLDSAFDPLAKPSAQPRRLGNIFMKRCSTKHKIDSESKDADTVTLEAQKTPEAEDTDDATASSSAHEPIAENIQAHYEATMWAEQYLHRLTSTTSRRARVTISDLRAYALWHAHDLSIAEIAATLRVPPLSQITVANYILKCLSWERDLPFDTKKAKVVMGVLRQEDVRARYWGIWNRLAEKKEGVGRPHH